MKCVEEHDIPDTSFDGVDVYRHEDNIKTTEMFSDCVTPRESSLANAVFEPSYEKIGRAII